MSVTWKQKILAEIIDFCNVHGTRTFTRQSFIDERLGLLQAFKPKSKTVVNKVSQQFQFLRDDGMLTFVNNKGSYTLRGLALLHHEEEALKELDLWDLRETSKAGGMQKPTALPETYEHLVEIYVRDKGWVKEAKQTFGTDCMICSCDNRFNKPDGLPYIEVHHIIPLCEKGEDGIWNLSVLCAHHHRMAHFADDMSKKDMRTYLLGKVEQRLK